MMFSRKSILAAVCLGLLSAPMFGTAAEAKHKAHHRRHIHLLAHRQIYLVAHRHSAGHYQRVTFEGEIVDRAGWRFRSAGWDNSCFNLPYLPSQFACSANN